MGGGGWLLVSFKTRKFTLHYAGNIISNLHGDENDGDFIISFVRKKAGKEHKFYWPEKQDVSTIDINQVAMLLPMPKCIIKGSRAKLEFPMAFHQYDGKVV